MKEEKTNFLEKIERLVILLKTNQDFQQDFWQSQSRALAQYNIATRQPLKFNNEELQIVQSLQAKSAEELAQILTIIAHQSVVEKTKRENFC